MPTIPHIFSSPSHAEHDAPADPDISAGGAGHRDRAHIPPAPHGALLYLKRPTKQDRSASVRVRRQKTQAVPNPLESPYSRLEQVRVYRRHGWPLWGFPWPSPQYPPTQPPPPAEHAIARPNLSCIDERPLGTLRTKSGRVNRRSVRPTPQVRGGVAHPRKPPALSARVSGAQPELETHRSEERRVGQEGS